MDNQSMAKITGIRELVRLAEDHALGILESQDDGAFWGDEFCDAHEDQYELMARAKEIVLNRIRKVTKR